MPGEKVTHAKGHLDAWVGQGIGSPTVTRSPISPDEGPITVERLLASARRRLRRLEPEAARAAMDQGAVLVDIRSDSQRAADGVVPRAHFISRNVVEWRLDPACPHRDPLLARSDARVIVLCNHGHQSSLVAGTVQRFGLQQVTDVVGGFQAWRAAGLPVQPQLSTGAAIRATDCPCGRHLAGVDDEELFRQAREHVDSEHPDLDRTDDQLREWIDADAYDVEPVG
jgi:rhodanese-related sulfurtransferase